MSDPRQLRSLATRFTLLHLMTITALIAVGISVVLAMRSKQALTLRRDELRAFSRRLSITNENELVSIALPAIANQFESWRVHVPAGIDYELRLGIGLLSEKGIPPVVGSVPIPAGQHRVTLVAEDSFEQEYRYLVYLDGAPVIEKTMGKQWLPNGFSSASGINWPIQPYILPPPRQLASQSYEARLDFGPQNFFNGHSDSYLTRPGYRLWIDQVGRIYPPASPFLGLSGDYLFQGIGLRDGIRYVSSPMPSQWTFTRPKLATMEPVLRMEAEFVTTDGTVVSSAQIKSWRLTSSATVIGSSHWEEEPEQSTCTAYLHALSKSPDVLQPVVELRWDVQRPDSVGLRLAQTPANDRISRWRLRIMEGRQQLWRELQVGDRPKITPIDALKDSQLPEQSSEKQSMRTAVIDLGDMAATDVRLQWQTNESLPLQILERSADHYAGRLLYQGLPVTLGMQVPAGSKPQLAVDIVEQHPTRSGETFRGGPVFEAIQIELEVMQPEWIWLNAQLKE